MNLAHDLATLPNFSVAQLRTRYAEVFDEPTNAAHKGWLVKRIAWRLQARAEGDLSERARQRAADLANDADLRLSPPKPRAVPAPELTRPAPDASAALGPVPRGPDRRLPLPGAVLTRPYKGQPSRATPCPRSKPPSAAGSSKSKRETRERPFKSFGN